MTSFSVGIPNLEGNLVTFLAPPVTKPLDRAGIVAPGSFFAKAIVKHQYHPETWGGVPSAQPAVSHMDSRHRTPTVHRAA